MSVSLNVARSWAQTAFTAGHQVGVDNPDLPDINIDDYRPKRGKKSSTLKKVVDKDLSSAEYNTSCCDARIWNQGHGGQCSKSPLDACDFCALHKKQYDASLEKGGTGLRNGRYSSPIPERTLDGSDEKIPWKKAGSCSPTSSKKPAVKHPRPRGPAPKSESGGRKLWDGDVGVWVEPKVDSDCSDTEDMSDEETVQKVEEPEVEATVENVEAVVEEPEVEAVVEDQPKVEAVVEDQPEVEEVVEEPEVGDQPKVEEVVEEPEVEAVVEEPKVEATVEKVEAVVEEPEVEDQLKVEEVVEEPKVEGTYDGIDDSAPEGFEPEPAPGYDQESEPELGEDKSQGAPSSIDTPTIDGDILKYQGVDYMFDADDGMMYHSETYDEVATFNLETNAITWKTKKFEIAHKKAAM
jgi:hypothetical protein